MASSIRVPNRDRLAAGWRIVKRRYAPSAFDGEGARLYGSRWTSPGRAVIYLAQSPSLAALEILVHVEDEAVLSGYVLFRVALEDLDIKVLTEKELPGNWRSPKAQPRLREIGDAWEDAGKTEALQVPSAVVPAESNLIVRPPALSTRKIDGPVAFGFDDRLSP